MKIIFSLLIGLFLFTLTGADICAQSHDMTIILLRHGEKDISPSADKVDPELAQAGNERAQRLVNVIRKYNPKEIYSTNFKRTRATVTPLADQMDERYRLRIQIYDHKKINDFLKQLLESNARTVVVVGHNTTTPTLANLLIKEEKYKALDESEYNKIWIIKIKKNKITHEVIEY